ncbi:MAG: hypothetical protein WD184_06890 [Acidimicrobiia bacterium]
MEEALIIQIGIGAGAGVLGLAGGFLLGRRRRRPGPENASDWKLRLAARDHDLFNAMDRLVEAEMAYQASMEQPTATPAGASDSAARIEALTEELAEAEDELTRLQVLGVDRTPAGGNLARRLETLESELATLESLRCPDPSAHRRSEVVPVDGIQSPSNGR